MDAALINDPTASADSSTHGYASFPPAPDMTAALCPLVLQFTVLISIIDRLAFALLGIPSSPMCSWGWVVFSSLVHSSSIHPCVFLLPFSPGYLATFHCSKRRSRSGQSHWVRGSERGVLCDFQAHRVQPMEPGSDTLQSSRKWGGQDPGPQATGLWASKLWLGQHVLEEGSWGLR